MLRDGRNALQNRSLLLENQRFPFTWKAYFKKSLKGQETDVFFNIPPWPYTYLLDHTSKRKFANNHDNHKCRLHKKFNGAACVGSAAEQITIFPPAERCDEVWRWHTSRQDLAWGLELMLVRIGDTVQWGQEATHKTGFFGFPYIGFQRPKVRRCHDGGTRAPKKISSKHQTSGDTRWAPARYKWSYNPYKWP